MSSLYPIFSKYMKMWYNKVMILNFFKIAIFLLSSLVLFIVTVVPVTAPSFSIFDLVMRIWIIANPIFVLISLIKKDDKWRHRFLTWGIAIAVFGMRFLFPILVVAAFSGLTVMGVAKLALYDVDKYAHYLHLVHAPLVTFGGAFLLMIFLSYFFNEKKECHWICCLEKPIQKLNCVKYVDVVVALVSLMILQKFIPEEQK